jgi:hypothetical protein
MPKDDPIGRMADEVIATIETTGANFNKAFALAAHARGVWHHLDKGRYNYLFRLVQKRVSNRKKALLRKTLKKGVTPEEILDFVNDQEYLKSPGFDPKDPRSYEDNHGFIHDPTAPYLMEAPC